MKHSIKTYKFEKVEISSTEMEIPEQPLYCFQTGIRRSIRIIPEYTTWNMERFNKEEEIWRLNVTYVYRNFENKIEMFNFQLRDLEEMVNNNKDSYNIGNMLLHKDYHLRTKEKFEEDLNAVISAINRE
jgi:hypothetical protein